LFLQVLFDCVCGGGEAEAGGDADEGSDPGGTVEKCLFRPTISPGTFLLFGK
jgi:hypothetical protein